MNAYANKFVRPSVCIRSDSLLTSSTLAAVLADVSMNISPCSRANASPSSFCTSRRAKRSLKTIEYIHRSSRTRSQSIKEAYHLFPMSIITMFEFECCRASSSQLVKWLNVWRLHVERNRCVINATFACEHLFLLRYIIDEQSASCSTIVWSSDWTETLLTSLNEREARREKETAATSPLTVSQICNFICLPSMVIMRAPNSTPRPSRFLFDWFSFESYRWLDHVQAGNVCRWIAVVDTIYRHLRTARRRKSRRSCWAHRPVSPMIIYLKRYA